MNVLVIDDSTATRFILSKMMRELGHTVEEAVNGKDALEKLELHPEMTVALVDWNMPVMNGLEFVVAARATRRFNAIKLVMVTTETDMNNVVRALEAGADEYVMKPFSKEMIQEKLSLIGIRL